MKKTIAKKSSKHLNLQTPTTKANTKTSFRHRDRGIHSGRASSK